MKILSLILLLLFGIIIGTNITACAKGSKPLQKLERKFQDNLYRPCQDFETKNPVGKVCNRTCVDFGMGKCKKWKTDVLDFNDRETFLKFRAAGFILIDEDQVL